ncbi:MAG TPA: HlyD family secretion protein [Steroidobacteraceae bacterium]|nr:HlyD family secretion protein [Steroidobacteraceae bacterium]
MDSAADGSTAAGRAAPPGGRVEERSERSAELRRARLRWPLMLGGLLVAAVAALAYYLLSGRYQSTDDSAVMAAQTTISTNIPGRVVELDVRDNQRVQRGEVLFRLDERPWRIAVEEAQAKLAAAQLQIHAAKASYRHELEDIAAARDTVAYEQREFARQQRLLQSGISSRAQFDQAQHALEIAQTQLGSAQQQANTYLALLGGNPNLPVQQHPLVLEALAALDRSQLQLSYTTIRAPSDGIVTRVEQLQVGDYVNAAAPVFSLISTRDVWVEANFKEDQLTYMRPGQSAEVSIDAYPGRQFRAQVVSLSPGTGAQFSLLPPENATGNWVKVVQRVPVRLRLLAADQSALPLDARLSGLSADVTVDTGHRRQLFGHESPWNGAPAFDAGSAREAPAALQVSQR